MHFAPSVCPWHATTPSLVSGAASVSVEMALTFVVAAGGAGATATAGTGIVSAPVAEIADSGFSRRRSTSARSFAASFRSDGSEGTFGSGRVWYTMSGISTMTSTESSVPDQSVLQSCHTLRWSASPPLASPLASAHTTRGPSSSSLLPAAAVEVPAAKCDMETPPATSALGTSSLSG